MLLNQKTINRNLSRIYSKSSFSEKVLGKLWYEMAGERIKREFPNLPFSTACAAVACGNINNSWEGSFAMARYILNGGGLPVAQKMFKKILSNDPLPFNKTCEFYFALQGSHALVIDRWMLRAMGIKKAPRTNSQYDSICSTFLSWVDSKGECCNHRDMQAIIWLTARRVIK